MFCSFLNDLPAVLYDWEKCLAFGEYGVTIGRTVLGLAALGNLCHGSGGELWRCCK